MDSQRSSLIKPDAIAHLRRLSGSIRVGDWQAADALARSFSDCDIPRERTELAKYLDALKQTVIQAKASRSIAAAELSRVRAAARFQNDAAVRFQSGRQDFADLTESRQLADSLIPLPSDT